MGSWRETFSSSWGKEFLAGGLGGMAGLIAGHPLDTVRVVQQSSKGGSAYGILRQLVFTNGPLSLYRGMGTPLAFVAFQNAMVFQINAKLSKVFDNNSETNDPPSYKGVALGGAGTGALQSLIVSPVELLKIQLQTSPFSRINRKTPMELARTIFRTKGIKGIFSGLTITVLRDGPSYGLYFLTYEYIREQLHPGCRKNGQESYRTMMISGGLAGVASWLCCYPLDLVKTRLQAQDYLPMKYRGIIDCFKQSVKQEGHSVLWRGLGATVSRAFIVHATIFLAYETLLQLPEQPKQHS